MPFIYVLVRVPKSGSSTLVSMVGEALPASTTYMMPKLMRGDDGVSRLDAFREHRARSKRFWRLFRTLSEETAWRRLAARARDGDVVAGHMPFGRPRLPGFEVRYITLLRDPVARLVSEYNYTRVGFASRSRVQQILHRGRLSAAAHRSFGGYIGFLEEHRQFYSDLATRYVAGEHVFSDPVGFLQAHYFHFGALERLQQFAAELGDKLGVPVVTPHLRRTPASASVSIGSADRARLERLYGRDIEMHQALLRHLDRVRTARE